MTSETRAYFTNWASGVRTSVRDRAGNPYARFRRALDRGNVIEALSAASELEHVGLVEALELLLLVHTKEPKRFGRARTL